MVDYSAELGVLRFCRFPERCEIIPVALRHFLAFDFDDDGIFGPDNDGEKVPGDVGAGRDGEGLGQETVVRVGFPVFVLQDAFFLALKGDEVFLYLFFDTERFYLFIVFAHYRIEPIAGTTDDVVRVSGWEVLNAFHSECTYGFVAAREADDGVFGSFLESKKIGQGLAEVCEFFRFVFDQELGIFRFDKAAMFPRGDDNDVLGSQTFDEAVDDLRVFLHGGSKICDRDFAERKKEFIEASFLGAEAEGLEG